VKSITPVLLFTGGLKEENKRLKIEIEHLKNLQGGTG